MIKTIILALLLNLIPFLINVGSANIEFNISVHQLNEKQDESRQVVKEENNYDMSVDLGKSYFSYIQEGTKFIYDFSNRRILTVGLSEKKYADDSLYSNIGFRTYEFQNKLMLGDVLAAADIKDNPMLPVFAEHNLSLQQKDKKSKLLKTVNNNTIHFSYEDKALMSFDKHGTEVSQEEKEMFVKFIRYVFGSHPQILESLSVSNIIPKSLKIHHYNVVNTKTTLTVSTINKTSNHAFSITNYSPGILPSDTDDFSRVLQKIGYSKDNDISSHLDTLLSEAQIFFQKKQYLDAMLTYLEYNLASSYDLPSAFHSQKKEITEDEYVIKLLASFSPKNKEEAETCLGNLIELEKKASDKKHVIMIFKANILASLGKHEEAKKAFQFVINTNSHITGAYKDLGGLYYNEYNTVMAWRCWDTARKIAPKHKMLQAIKSFEEKLLHDHPEFF